MDVEYGGTVNCVNGSEDEQVPLDDVDAAAAFFPAPRPGYQMNSIHYFFDAEKEGKKKCLHCSRSVVTSATVMKRHLSTFHADQFALFQQKQKEIAMNPKNSAMKRLTKRSTISSKRVEQIEIALGRVAAMPTCSFNFLLSDRVRRLMTLMEPRYSWPASRTKLLALIEPSVSKLKTNLIDLLNSAPKVAVSADIWSQRGMAHSYIAITAHFYSEHTKNLEHCLLSIEQLFGRHTALLLKNICLRVLSEYHLTEDSVSFYVTDNGCNIVKAYRQTQLLICSQLESEEAALKEEVSPAEQAIFIADRNIEEEDVEEIVEEVIAQVSGVHNFYCLLFN
jgi:hypothetical protein